MPQQSIVIEFTAIFGPFPIATLFVSAFKVLRIPRKESVPWTQK
jgi:hypothetical protein